MQAAIKRVTHLRVTQLHTYHPQNQEGSPSLPADCNILSELPGDFQTVATTGYQLLAAALPCLEKLTVGRDAGSSAISAFGLSCTRLVSLELDLLSSSTAACTEALQDLSRHLPHLTHLKLRGEYSRSINYGTCLSAALAHLHACAKLTVLDVDVGGSTIRIDRQEPWDLLPASLREFCCRDPLLTVMSPAFCARLKRLTLWTICDQSLEELLRKCPLLQELTVQWRFSVELLCKAHKGDHGGELYLKERFESGFRLCCPCVRLSGPVQVVRDVLEWLPPLLSVNTCNMGLSGESHVECLQQIARVFPSIESLSLDANDVRDDASVSIDVQVLSALAECDFLRELHFWVKLRGLSTTWLVDLCQSVPTLKVLRFYYKSHGIHWERFHQLVGREIEVYDSSHRNVPGVDNHVVFGNG